jgi:hypothetical protein
MTTRQQARYDRLLPHGIPRYVHVYDNGGASIDRYTCVFTRLNTGYCQYLAMSGAPFHPQGFCQWGEHTRAIDYPRYGHLGKKIGFTDLPADCQQAVVQGYKDIWKLTEE